VNALRTEVEARKAKSHADQRAALQVCLGTPAGRRVWLWFREVVLLADRRAGRWDATDLLDRALREFPELSIALAKDRAAIEADEAIYEAGQLRLKAEEAKETRNG
jgi:hypothetical protein